MSRRKQNAANLSPSAAPAAKRQAPSRDTGGACFFDDDATGATDSGGASIPLVMFEESGFRVNDAAIDLLASIEPPLAVVSVAGVYRTGKSFLLNRVILNGKGKFSVGPTTRACTKGIWMWSEPIVAEDAKGNKTNIIVIDTEGIGATTADASHDTRIFALGLLLSSYFIYNSVGSIDEQALDRMSLVANLSKEIRGKVSVDVSSGGSEEEEEEKEEAAQSPLRHSFPAFLWVVRDFALQLQDGSGRAIGAKEYLEDALTDCDMKTPAAASKNRIRAALRDFFPERDCFTMVRPLMDETQLQLLDTLPDRQLRPQFLEQAAQLRARVVEEAQRRPLKVNECELSGSLLGLLCRQYVDAINAGQVPVIQDAWSYVCDAQRAKTEAKLVADFQATLATLPAQPGVITPGQFAAATAKALQHALDSLETTCRRLFPHDAPDGFVSALQETLAPLEKGAVHQFQLQYTATLSRAVTTAQRDVEGAMSRREYASITDFRKALHAAHKAFLAKYVDMDDDSVRDSANAAWYADADTLVWRAISDYYSQREQQLSSFKGEAERLETVVHEMSKTHAQALAAQDKALREEAAAQAQAWAAKLNQLEATLADVRDAAEQRTTRIAALEQELASVTDEACEARRALEQVADEERARAAAAERKVLQLGEDLEEAQRGEAYAAQLGKEVAEVTLERNRLRADLAEARREAEDTARTKRDMEATFRKEAKDMQTKAMQSLQTMKDMRMAEQAKLRSKRDRAESKCAELEGRCRGLEEDLLRKTQQLEQAASAHEQQARQLRTDLEGSKARTADAEREYTERLKEAERVKKERERALEESTRSAGEERQRLEQDHRLRLAEANSRADKAVRDAEEYKRQLKEVGDQLEARKQQRVDHTLTNELTHARAELSDARRNASAKEDEVRTLRTKVSDVERRLWDAERKLDLETTKLKMEYENRIAQLERQQMHASSDDE